MFKNYKYQNNGKESGGHKAAPFRQRLNATGLSMMAISYSPQVLPSQAIPHQKPKKRRPRRTQQLGHCFTECFFLQPFSLIKCLYTPSPFTREFFGANHPLLSLKPGLLSGLHSGIERTWRQRSRLTLKSPEPRAAQIQMLYKPTPPHWDRMTFTVERSSQAKWGLTSSNKVANWNPAEYLHQKGCF